MLSTIIAAALALSVQHAFDTTKTDATCVKEYTEQCFFGGNPCCSPTDSCMDTHLQPPLPCTTNSSYCNCQPSSSKLPKVGDACTWDMGCSGNATCQQPKTDPKYKCTAPLSTTECKCTPKAPPPSCGGKLIDPGTDLCCGNTVFAKAKAQGLQCCALTNKPHNPAQTSCHDCNGYIAKQGEACQADECLPPINTHCCAENTAGGFPTGLYPDKDYPTSDDGEIRVGPPGTHSDPACPRGYFCDSSKGPVCHPSMCVPAIGAECCNLIGTGCVPR